MFDDVRLSKVEILIQQEKYPEAEKLLAQLLAEAPNNAELLRLFAEVKLEQEEYQEALEIINNAVGIEPDNPYLFFTKSRINLQLDLYKDAEDNIQAAIESDPYQADFLAFKAHIKLIRKQFETALELSNQALEIDAEHLLALNTRSTALNKLNRSAESFETIEHALREDPNNLYTHSNYGWGLLEKGDHKKALKHFKEALSKDPNYQYAQAGMIEAIKATNPIYRLFLKYAFWIGKLSAKNQWVVIIGFYVLFRVLRSLAKNVEALQPVLVPVLFILAIIAFSTWVINPIGNLFLRFNKYGNLLLDKDERLSSNLVAISAILFLAGLILFAITSQEIMIALAAFGFAMMLPLGTMFSPSKPKNALLIYTIVLAIAGLSGLALSFLTNKLFTPFTWIFIIGFIGYQWVANYFIIKEDNI